MNGGETDMSKLLKKIISFVIVALSVLTATGCGGNAETSWYVDQSDGNFNKSLFYRNESYDRGADPSTIWVSEEENAKDGGYFYSYVTATSTINAFRSKNLTDWQDLGGVFRPNLNESWAYMNYWAPSVRYDEEEQKYFMFYNATWKDKGKNRFYLSLAVSDSPMGPFVEYTDENKGVGEPLIDFAKIAESSPYFEQYKRGYEYESGYMSVIDPEQFVDPVSGKKYLLFVHDKGAAYTTSEIYIMEMKDWYTPLYETITKLTENGRTTVGGLTESDDGTVNEGPFMYYRNGTYYLTFSVNVYNEASYQVRQAVSDSPTGPFRKIAYEDGGAIITTDGLAIYTRSSGHASILDIGGEPYISYHTFFNDEDIGNGRKIRIDKLEFITNKEGIEIMSANGPTVTPQYLPEKISGYKNVARKAYVTATGGENGSSTYYINDGTLKMHMFSETEEFLMNKNGSVNLSFDDYVTARAIIVYNSRAYKNAFSAAKIEIEYQGKDGKSVKCSTDNLKFNFSLYASVDYKLICAGASVVAEFNEMKIKNVKVTFSSDNDVIGVPEIVILGKEGKAQ